VQLNRSISAVVALGYMLVVVFRSHPTDFRHALTIMFISYLPLLLPLACIWFPEEMGEYTGNLAFPQITKTTPAVIIRVGGWCLLIVEFLVLLLMLGYFGI